MDQVGFFFQESLQLDTQPLMQPQGEKTEQPQATPAMTVSGGGSKNAKNVPVNSEGKREWSHGLFDCFADCSVCKFDCLLQFVFILKSPNKIGCFASFLPSMMYSRVKHRIEHLNANGRPEPNGGGTGFDGDCLKHYCCTHLLYCGFVLQVMLLDCAPICHAN